MMDFSQKLHRTETLSYRGWNHTFEAFTLPTRPKNQYQNKTLEWDTLLYLQSSMGLDIFNKHDVWNDSSNIVFSSFNENKNSG